MKVRDWVVIGSHWSQCVRNGSVFVEVWFCVDVAAVAVLSAKVVCSVRIGVASEQALCVTALPPPFFHAAALGPILPVFHYHGIPLVYRWIYCLLSQPPPPPTHFSLHLANCCLFVQLLNAAADKSDAPQPQALQQQSIRIFVEWLCVWGQSQSSVIGSVA